MTRKKDLYLRCVALIKCNDDSFSPLLFVLLLSIYETSDGGICVSFKRTDYKLDSSNSLTLITLLSCNILQEIQSRGL